MSIRTIRLFIASLTILPVVLAPSPRLQDGASDWPTYNHDLAGTRFSPLTQINTQNVSRLTPAWTYRPADNGGRASAESTPIVVGGVMYLTAGNRVVALEPETGKEIWRYDLKAGQASQRGVAYWPGDDTRSPRIVFTSGTRLLALDAATGKASDGFGDNGEIDMTVGYGGVPTIYKNVAMVGAAVGEYVPLGPPGDSRGFDARTGTKLWDFHSVPRPNETGHSTWEGDSWKDRSGVNVWGFQMTVDESRGIVYMTFGAPTSTYYGGDRKGDNLFANSVVAIDAETGKYIWHFQTIHHDIWDYDLPTSPGLIDIVKDGQKIPALAQTGKLGLMFILDRVTGKPVFGVEERPVPQTDVPGEQTSKTQPFPVKPPPLAKNTFKPEDIVTENETTPEHAKACRELMERSGGFYNEGPYTPWLYRAEGAPPRSSIIFPGSTGGTNWGGTASDPTSGYVYTFIQNIAFIGWMQKMPAGYADPLTRERSTVPFDRGSESGPGPYQQFAVRVNGPDGRPVQGGTWPCQKPPWGQLVAVNANTGEIAWRATVGVTDELPEGKRNTGRTGLAGPIVTAGGLVFLGATNDSRFRAFDARTGKELWATKLDYAANAVPISYQGRNGKQYVAVMSAGAAAAGATPNSQSLRVFSLP